MIKKIIIIFLLTLAADAAEEIIQFSPEKTPSLSKIKDCEIIPKQPTVPTDTPPLQTEPNIIEDAGALITLLITPSVKVMKTLRNGSANTVMHSMADKLILHTDNIFKDQEITSIYVAEFIKKFIDDFPEREKSPLLLDFIRAWEIACLTPFPSDLAAITCQKSLLYKYEDLKALDKSYRDGYEHLLNGLENEAQQGDAKDTQALNIDIQILKDFLPLSILCSIYTSFEERQKAVKAVKYSMNPITKFLCQVRNIDDNGYNFLDYLCFFVKVYPRDISPYETHAPLFDESCRLVFIGIENIFECKGEEPGVHFLTAFNFLNCQRSPLINSPNNNKSEDVCPSNSPPPPLDIC